MITEDLVLHDLDAQGFDLESAAKRSQLPKTFSIAVHDAHDNPIKFEIFEVPRGTSKADVFIHEHGGLSLTPQGLSPLLWLGDTVRITLNHRCEYLVIDSMDAVRHIPQWIADRVGD